MGHGNSPDSEYMGSRSIQNESEHIHDSPPFTLTGHGSYCVPCQHYLMTEDLMAGMRRNGRMSAVRRFFCLFVTFDLLFTSLLWMICLVLAGNFNFYDAFYSQIVHYNIKTSAFDIVMAAALRFTSLLLFYALLHINHWVLVGSTTAGTSVFLVAKVYLFNWSLSNQPVLLVLLILSSFILSWSEAWFLDLKVIPQERQARHFLNASDERAPLLHSFLAGTSRMSESIGTFYSPVESPEDSGDESERPTRRKSKQQTLLNEMIVQFKLKGEDVVNTAWELMNSERWSIEKETSEGDTIFSQKLTRGQGTIFLLVGVIDIAPAELFEILWHKIENIPDWNPTIKESKIIQVIDDFTDICYQLTAEAGGGVITSRDFVILRHWEDRNGYRIIANTSVTCPCMPPDSKYIRGENGPGCWAIRKLPEENRCELKWLLNTNIKGWLPQYAVNSSLSGVITEYMIHLRRLVTVKSSMHSS